MDVLPLHTFVLDVEGVLGVEEQVQGQVRGQQEGFQVGQVSQHVQVLSGVGLDGDTGYFPVFFELARVMIGLCTFFC